MRAPIVTAKLDEVDAVIVDPPCAGAAAQCEQLAASGYWLDGLRVIDQFRFASHIELVAGFRRDT